MKETLVAVGRIVGLYGVRGWVKVVSYTDPRKNIFDYGPWYLSRGAEPQQIELQAGRPQGKGLVAQLADVEDRDAAAQLIDAEILVPRSEFGEPQQGQYFWHDLIGMRVATLEGNDLGVVESLLATGANDVLVVQGDRRRLIPFVIDAAVRQVDLEQRTISVDWDPEF